MLEDFALFIISHNRPINMTWKTLQKCNYKGPFYFILDDKDRKIKSYQKLYGAEHVKIFSKKEIAKKIDMMDNFDYDSVITYARNACYDIAEELGVKYFLTLDDDYDQFRLRFPHEKTLLVMHSKNLEKIIDCCLNYYKKCKGIRILAMCQGSDLQAIQTGKVLRKAMNALFCCTERRVWFNGHLNEDVTTYTRYNQLGNVFMSLPNVHINQLPTQTGGEITGAYQKYGTYGKTFYSVMQCPTFVKVSTFSKGFRMSAFRIHHKITSRYGYAKIISDKFKK